MQSENVFDKKAGLLLMCVIGGKETPEKVNWKMNSDVAKTERL